MNRSAIGLCLPRCGLLLRAGKRIFYTRVYHQCTNALHGDLKAGVEVRGDGGSHRGAAAEVHEVPPGAEARQARRERPASEGAASKVQPLCNIPRTTENALEYKLKYLQYITLRCATNNLRNAMVHVAGCEDLHAWLRLH